MKKRQNYGKKWPPGGHLESEDVANILIRLVIPQNPPFGIGTDTLCAILLEIYVKTQNYGKKYFAKCKV